MVEGELLIDGFNESCNNTTASYLKVEDEFMIEIRFWTIENGNLLHLSYIFAIRIHWGQSSIHSPVLLQGPCY